MNEVQITDVGIYGQLFVPTALNNRFWPTPDFGLGYLAFIRRWTRSQNRAFSTNKNGSRWSRLWI